MKDRILKTIDDFVSTCYTCFKIGAGDFAKENFPKIVESFWEDGKSDEENFEQIRNAFEINLMINNDENVRNVFDVFIEGWLKKIEI